MDKSIAATTISVHGEKSAMSVKSNPAISITTLPEAERVVADDSGVRVLGLDEYKQAAACLAEAFADDHTIWYFIDTPDRAHWTREQKWELHVKSLEYITYAHLLKGLVVSAGPNYDCVALW